MSTCVLLTNNDGQCNYHRCMYNIIIWILKNYKYERFKMLGQIILRSKIHVQNIRNRKKIRKQYNTQYKKKYNDSM